MAKIKNENFIAIQGFMVKELGLSGNELIAYALIYGFSQDNESEFKGSLNYVAEWLNCSKTTAFNLLNKLADDGFVDNELYIDLSLYEDFSSSGVPLPNDLMITAVGTLGKVYIVKESDKFYYKDGSVLCLANKYGLCAEYLKMVIESPFFKGQYRQESQGTTVATLTMVRLQKYFIPLPPLQEQYRIVEKYEKAIASIMRG